MLHRTHYNVYQQDPHRQGYHVYITDLETLASMYQLSSNLRTAVQAILAIHHHTSPYFLLLYQIVSWPVYHNQTDANLQKWLISPQTGQFSKPTAIS